MTASARRTQGNRKQKGVALIVVLMLLAVMVSLAATMSERLFINFQRAESQRDYQQAYWYAIGVEALAKYAVSESFADSETINLSQAWALEEQVYPLDYGEASGHIRDMQSCLNLNAFGTIAQSNDNSTPYLVSVLQYLLEDLGVENYQAETIAASVREFVDSDSDVDSASGAEDSSYEALNPPYLAANGMLADSSEFRAVNQVDGKVMRQVWPVLCALPTDEWRLNVNTVSEQGALLLSALFNPHLSGEDAKSLVENRPYDGWDTVDAFLSESAIAAIDDDVKDKAKAYLTVDSRYFELDAQVLVNESRVRIRSLLYSNNRDDVNVVRRRFGGISERISDRSTQ